MKGNSRSLTLTTTGMASTTSTAIEKERALLDASVDSIRTLTTEEKWIRFDSFIAPAVARGMFDSLHFYCLQGGEDGDVGIDEELLASTGTLQVLHETPEAFAALVADSPLIFDLCLDLFNRSENIQEGDSWSDAEVLQFFGTGAATDR